LPPPLFTNLAGDREVSLWYEPWLKEGTRAEHFRFGPVLNQNNQPNRIIFFLIF
jgi:hypothetical protein